MEDATGPGKSPESILLTAGLRRTPVRAAVLQVLSASGQPLDVPRLLAELPPFTDTVTVYRTLNTFTRKKLVHRVRGENRTWLYAIGGTEQKSKHQHPHFVCEGCGRVECLTASIVPKDLPRSLGVGRKYAITYSEVVMHGLCPQCHTAG